MAPPSPSSSASGPKFPGVSSRPTIAVLLQVPRGVGDTDPGANQHELRESATPARRGAREGDARRRIRLITSDRVGVETHLRGHVRGVPLLLPERREQHVVGDVGVTLRIGRARRSPERVAELVHRAEQRQRRRGTRPGPSRRRPRRTRVGSPRVRACKQLLQMRASRIMCADRCGMTSCPRAASCSARSNVASIPWLGDAVTVTWPPPGATRHLIR